MADYRILVGTELKTDGITAALNNYKGRVKVGVTLDTSDITTAINGYKSKPISVDTKLNTNGITDAIRNYTPPKKIHLESDLSTVGIDAKIKNYIPKSAIKVDAELTASSINQQIRGIKPSESIKLDAKLNNSAITDAIRKYKATTPIKVMVDPDFSEAGAKISGYQMRNMLKVNVKLNKTAIDSQIKNFQTGSKIEVGAKLRENAIETAIKRYAGKELVPITIDFKVGETKEITNKINEYKNKSVSISAKLQPAQTGFDSAITKKPVKIQATLDPNGINEVIEKFSPISKIKVGVKLDPKDINGQLTKLPKPTEQISVDAKLNDASINNAIAKIVPTSRIKTGVSLKTDDINKQIEAIHPTSKVNVRVNLDNSNIDEKTGKQNVQEPVTVNVKLNTEKINEQIKAFKTQSKISVGVKLDFASHKGGQVGIPQQIKDYKTSAKIKVGVELDKDDITQQIGQVKVDSPIKLGVELDPEGVQRVQKQVDNFREQIKALGNVKINLGGGNVVAGEAGKGNVKVAGVSREFAEADIKITDMANHTKSLQSALKKIGFNKSAIASITQEFEELDVTVKSVTSRLDKAGNLSLTIKGLDDVGRAVTMMKGVDKKGGLTSLGTSVSQSFKETEASFTRLKNLANQIKGLDVKRVGLDTEKDKQRIAELNSQLKVLKTEYKDLFNITRQNLNTSQLDELERKSTEAANAVKVAKAAMADKTAYNKEQAEIKETRDEYQKLIKMANSMKRIKVTLAGLDTEKDKQRIAELTSQLKTLKSEYDSLFASKKGSFDTNQLDALKQKSIETKKAVKEVKAAMADDTANFARGIRDSFSGYDAKVQSLKSGIMGLSQPTQELVDAFANVERAWVDMKKNASNNSELIAAEERYQAALKETEAQLQINNLLENQPNASGVANDFAIKKEAALTRIRNLFENGSQAANRFGAEARKLTKELNNVGSVSGIDRVDDKIANLEKKIKMSNLQTKTFTTRLKDQFSKYSQYLSIASVFMYAAQAARSMFEQVKLIDSAMTELKKVTDETDAAYDRFLSNAASKAKEIGTTIDGLVSSTADFARLGYGFEDAQGLAEVANIYAVVGDEIEGVEQATESLISTMAAFKDETSDVSNTDFAMDIIDKFNEIGNNFAISSGGIGEAMERSASSMKAANNTIDETIALITAANTVVQNPDAVGTAFKTISMRIRGAKTELEDAGLETEGMVQSTAKLRQEIMALSGVDIMESDGQTFKSTYAILDELALKWKDLSDIQQATITELIAGKVFCQSAQKCA